MSRLLSCRIFTQTCDPPHGLAQLDSQHVEVLLSNTPNPIGTGPAGRTEEVKVGSNKDEQEDVMVERLPWAAHWDAWLNSDETEK